LNALAACAACPLHCPQAKADDQMTVAGSSSGGLQERARESAEARALAGAALNLPTSFAASALCQSWHCFLCAGCCAASCADSSLV
jgi:hypothetical protein